MNCYLCANTQLSVVTNKLRHGELRDVLKCPQCGLVRLQAKTASLDQYYREEYRTLYTPVIGEISTSREIFEMYRPHQERRVSELRPLINRSTSILEVGCSAGHFLDAINPYVNECVGIEYNAQDAEFVNKELGIKTYSQPIEETDILKHHFDIIAVLQVLEHIEDPSAFLRTLGQYIKPGGYLCIEVPNVEEALLSVYNLRNYLDFYFKEPHIFYYSPDTLGRLMKMAGFSGEMKTIQRYNVMNHLHWLFTGKPQRSAEEGMSSPMLVTREGADKKITDDFNRWINEIDKSYRELLTNHGLGESIWFLGQRATG